MADIVVFISSKFSDTDAQKIAELMRIREIQTTNNRRNATVVLEPVIYDRQSEDLSIVIATEPNKPTTTLADIAEKLITETHGRIFQLREDLMANIPEVIIEPMILPKKSHHRKQTYQKQSLSRFNSINNIRNNRIYTRTKHK
jgi:hypothetical protein